MKRITQSIMIAVTLVIALSSSSLHALERKRGLQTLLKEELSKTYQGAKINFLSSVHWSRGEPQGELTNVSILGDDGKGNAHFTGFSLGRMYEGWVGFSAYLPAKIALRRIHPGESLSPSLFLVQQVNVAEGQAHEYRGLIITGRFELDGLEAIQSILEGQFLVSSAIQRIPDIRRGDAVKIHLVSGKLVLSTLGVASEPAYLYRQVRVVAGRNKRELLGRLEPGGVVEVQL